jgi:hypothetical protein
LGFDVKVTGLDELLTVRRKLKQVGDAGLGKPMGKKLKQAAQPLQREIRAVGGGVAPGGYAAVLPASLRFRQRLDVSRVTALLTIRVFGQGRRQRRDIPSVNAGVLRHKLFGNPRYWFAQAVRPGFVDRPFDANKQRVVDAVGEVLDDFIEEIS